MMMNKKHNIIENKLCTHFEKTKLCAFIFESFKKAIDCIIIENPLNDKIPEVKIIDILLGKIESVFAPRVTSKIP